jgi:hypothetical protein
MRLDNAGIIGGWAVTTAGRRGAVEKTRDGEIRGDSTEVLPYSDYRVCARVDEWDCTHVEVLYVNKNSLQAARVCLLVETVKVAPGSHAVDSEVVGLQRVDMYAVIYTIENGRTHVSARSEKHH